MARGRNREALVEEGLRLLLDGGFQATGVQEITSACGVPKGSFYNYFESKTEFGVEVLRAYAERSREQLHRALAGPGRPIARLRALYEGWIEGMGECGFKGGCLVGNLTQEMADRDETFRTELETMHRAAQEAVAAVLREAREAGEIPADEDPDRLAAFLVNSWQGALLRMKATGSAGPLREFVHQVFERRLNPATT